MERRGKEHVEKEQLRNDVDEVQQFDEDVDDHQIVTTAAKAEKTASSTTTTTFHLITGTEAAQVSTVNP